MKVVVATYVDGMVRIYAGIPQDGGMEQLGQFATTRDIEPTALANMAVDLSAQFGWLVELAPAPVTKVASEPKALAPYEIRKKELVACGICKKRILRKSLAHHLVALHGRSEASAKQLAKSRPALEGETKPAPKYPPKTPARVKGHGRQGLHGAAILEREILPGVLQLVRLHGEQTSADIAKRYDVGTSTGLAWLRKLERQGQVVQLTPADAPQGTLMRFGPAEANGVTETELPSVPLPLYADVSITEHEGVTYGN